MHFPSSFSIIAIAAITSSSFRQAQQRSTISLKSSKGRDVTQTLTLERISVLQSDPYPSLSLLINLETSRRVYRSLGLRLRRIDYLRKKNNRFSGFHTEVSLGL